MTLHSKLPDVNTSIFTRIGGLANAAKALNLAQGFPDFGVDPLLPELIDQFTRKGYNQYAPDIGVADLRKAISQKKGLLYGYAPDPDQEITITIGATEALFSTFQALIHSGDEVIYFEPAYDSYAPGIRLAGGIPVPINLNPPDFKISWANVEAMITDHTKMVVINNPHNPSGSILTHQDLEQLEALANKYDLLVLSDEVYQHLTYDEAIHHSVLRYPALFSRSVITMSFGKTFHATGWRLGYAIAPPEISKEIRRVHQFNTFSAYTPVQYALASYLSVPEHYLNLPLQFQRRRDRFWGQLNNDAFKKLPCKGTYFACLDFSELWDGTDFDLAVKLINDHGIAAIPLGEFYGPPRKTGIMRFCFAKGNEKLDKAAEILNNLKL